MDVIWQPRAFKQLKKIGERAIQGRILAASRGLSKFPACSNVKRLADNVQDIVDRNNSHDIVDLKL